MGKCLYEWAFKWISMIRQQRRWWWRWRWLRRQWSYKKINSDNNIVYCWLFSQWVEQQSQSVVQTTCSFASQSKWKQQKLCVKQWLAAPTAAEENSLPTTLPTLTISTKKNETQKKTLTATALAIAAISTTMTATATLFKSAVCRSSAPVCLAPLYVATPTTINTNEYDRMNLMCIFVVL